MVMKFHCTVFTVYLSNKCILGEHKRNFENKSQVLKGTVHYRFFSIVDSRWFYK